MGDTTAGHLAAAKKHVREVGQRIMVDQESNRQPAEQTREPLMPKGARDFLLGLVATLALLAFGAIYVIVFACTLDVGALCRSAKLDDPQLLSAATGLTGLVGGVVAVALGQQDLRPVSNGNGGGSNGGGTSNRTLSLLRSMGLRAVLAVLYTFVYAAFGLAAVVIWIFAPDNASDVLKALASVALGLLLPIVRSYFIPGE